MQALVVGLSFFLGILTLVQGGPYTKKGRETANSSLVSAAQWFLQERLLAVEVRVLNLSVDVGRLAERTTQEAFRLSEKAKDRVKGIEETLHREFNIFRPLMPQCFNTDYKKVSEKIYNATNEVYMCTHRVADEGTSFEVAMTLHLSDARNQIWHVQEAMYFCEKYSSQVYKHCLKRLTVEYSDL